MWKVLWISSRFMAVATLSLGLAYPLGMTLVAATVAPWRAGGSLLEVGGVVVGSERVVAPSSEPGAFWPRPSATSPRPWDGAASAGSNLGPTSPELAARVWGEARRLREAHPDHPGPIPVELLTTSGSGLDPDLSVEGARYQAGRVARARGVEIERVLALIDAQTQAPLWGMLGEPTVNVLLLNLALDGVSPVPHAPDYGPHRE